MTTKVFFYLLNERFVENDEQVPEQAKQVMYYSTSVVNTLVLLIRKIWIWLLQCLMTHWVVRLSVAK